MALLQHAIEDLLTRNEISVQEAAELHLMPAFRQRVNGQWHDRASFVRQIAELRRLITSATVPVLDEMLDGKRYAERHIIHLKLKTGAQIHQQVFVFGTLSDDGRFSEMEEATVAVEPGTGN